MSKKGSSKGDPWGRQGGPTNHQPRTRTPKFLKTVFSLESRACRFVFSKKTLKSSEVLPCAREHHFWTSVRCLCRKNGPPPATCLQDLSQGLPKPPQGPISNDFGSIFGSKFDKVVSIFRLEVWSDKNGESDALYFIPSDHTEFR